MLALEPLGFVILEASNFHMKTQSLSETRFTQQAQRKRPAAQRPPMVRLNRDIRSRKKESDRAQLYCMRKSRSDVSLMRVPNQRVLDSFSRCTRIL